MIMNDIHFSTKGLAAMESTNVNKNYICPYLVQIPHERFQESLLCCLGIALVELNSKTVDALPAMGLLENSCE